MAKPKKESLEVEVVHKNGVFDFCAAESKIDAMDLPRCYCLISTDMKVYIPTGSFGTVYPNNSLVKEGIGILSTVITSEDNEKDLEVMLFSCSPRGLRPIRKGEKLGHIVIQKK